MKSFIRLKESPAVRLAASVVAVAAIVAGATGIAAGSGNAAPPIKPIKPDKGSRPFHKPKFKHPKLKHGVLTIKGTRESDTVALRVQAGQPGILQVDVGDDGSADFSFERARITAIAVNARAGDDIVRIDDTAEGQDGTDTMVFNGAGIAEQVDLSANGNRLRFFRTQATITMDTAGVERVDFNALGGADVVIVGDLSGT